MMKLSLLLLTMLVLVFTIMLVLAWRTEASEPVKDANPEITIEDVQQKEHTITDNGNNCFSTECIKENDTRYIIVPRSTFSFGARVNGYGIRIGN